VEQQIPVKASRLFLRKAYRSFGRSWKLFRQSRLGIAGLSMILAFAVMAIFAPLVAPFSEDFLAPDQDVFELGVYTLNYTSESEFRRPVVGPMISSYVTISGAGTWIVVAQSSGTVNLTFTRLPQANATPFEAAGNMSFELRIQDLGLQPPLSDILFLVPGATQAGALGSLVQNGLLAFVANTTFAVIDPFKEEIVYQASVGFEPTWVVQDPISAGELPEIPSQKRTRVGAIAVDVGPFRYIAVANETRLEAFQIEYVYTGLPVRGKAIFNATVPEGIAAEPFPYSRPGKDIIPGYYVPSADGKLQIYNVTGELRTVLNVTLDGEPAQVTAPLGFARGDFPIVLTLPVRSATQAGVLYLAPAEEDPGFRPDRIAREFVINRSDAVIEARPDLAPAGEVHVVANFAGGAPAARVYRLDVNATEVIGFFGDMDEPARELYVVATVSRVIVLGQSGRVYSVSTILGQENRTGVVPFFEGTPNVRWIVNVGSLVGTRYGALSAQEVYGLFFDAGDGVLTLHQFTGTTRAPLPPGTYPSGNTYWFGTDNLGHDILTQLIFGSRVALLVGVLAAFFAVFVGTFVGLVSGYTGGVVDAFLMRLTDIVLVLPGLAIILIMVAILGPNVFNIILIIAILGWPGIARVIRAQTLSLKERPFVDAARVAGASDFRIMFRHIAPNVVPFTFLYMTLAVAGAILTEAALSFLGLGDPRVATWGTMLSTVQTSGSLAAWWWVLPPGLSITLISLGFYLVGRAADEIVNPRLRRR
jgi:peptide/nickel transport system permease protein